MSEIIDETIFLGPGSVGVEISKLRQWKVKYILNAAVELPNFYPDDFTYLKCPVEDDMEEEINRYFEHAHDFIDQAKPGEAIYIHCQAGISRSATLLLSYLIKRKRFSLLDAYKLVRSRRECISPNQGFLKRLQELEQTERGSVSMSVHEFHVQNMIHMGFDRETAENALEAASDNFYRAVRDLTN